MFFGRVASTPSPMDGIGSPTIRGIVAARQRDTPDRHAGAGSPLAVHVDASRASPHGNEKAPSGPVDPLTEDDETGGRPELGIGYPLDSLMSTKTKVSVASPTTGSRTWPSLLGATPVGAPKA